MEEFRQVFVDITTGLFNIFGIAGFIITTTSSLKDKFPKNKPSKIYLPPSVAKGNGGLERRAYGMIVILLGIAMIGASYAQNPLMMLLVFSLSTGIYSALYCCLKPPKPADTLMLVVMWCFVTLLIIFCFTIKILEDLSKTVS